MVAILRKAVTSMCGGWFNSGMPFMWMGGSFWFFTLLVIIAIGALVAVNRSQNKK